MQSFFVDNEDWSDCLDVQADLSLSWVHMSEGTFSHVAAQIMFICCNYDKNFHFTTL